MESSSRFSGHRWSNALLVALFGVAASAAPLVALQAPVPAALKTAKTAFLKNVGTEQKWLDVLANEVRQSSGLRLVDAQRDADIIIELGAASGATTVALPVYGGGFLAVSDASFTLVVREVPSGDLLWSDKASVDWSNKGALKSLVRRLNDRRTSRGRGQ